MRYIRSYDRYRLIKESEFNIESFLKGVQRNYKLSEIQFKEFADNYSYKLKEIVLKSTDKNVLKYKPKYEDYLKHLDNLFNNLKNTGVKSEMDIPELFKYKYGKELIKDDIDKYNDLINSSDNKEKLKNILKSLINDEDKFILKLHELYTELYNKRNPGTKINPNLEGLKPVAEYDNGNIKVFRVNSLRDSQILGKNTSFCITGTVMYGSYVYKNKNNIWYIYDYNSPDKNNEINVVMLNNQGKFNFTNIINQTKINLTYEKVLSYNNRLGSIDNSLFSSYEKVNDYYYKNPKEVNPSKNIEDQIAALIGSLDKKDIPHVDFTNNSILDFLVHTLDEYNNVDHGSIYTKFNTKQKHDYFNSGGCKGIPIDKYLTMIKNTKLNNNNSNIKKVVNNLINKLGNDADLNFLDVSNVTDMSNLFYECGKFDGDISKWDVSNVTNMSYMFYGCSKFNRDLSKWNVGNVKSMWNMFCWCKSFNGDLSKWDVSNVTNMCNIFNMCKNFNVDISKWNVSKVIDMGGMFSGCSKFNRDLYKWDVSSVENMSDMFAVCRNFNGNVSNWDVGNVTKMSGMFTWCDNFNVDISKWNISNVTNMVNMFNGCKKFNYDLSNWVKINPKFKGIIPKV